MTNRDLANATGLAAWIVANGYRPHMTRKMLQRLVRADPDAPKPVPSAGSETVYSLSQWRCYLDPHRQPEPGPPLSRHEGLPGRGRWKRDGATCGRQRLRTDHEPDHGAAAS
jgi:hypothetical protein